MTVQEKGDWWIEMTTCTGMTAYVEGFRNKLIMDYTNMSH